MHRAAAVHKEKKRTQWGEFGSLILLGGASEPAKGDEKILFGSIGSWPSPTSVPVRPPCRGPPPSASFSCSSRIEKLLPFLYREAREESAGSSITFFGRLSFYFFVPATIFPLARIYIEIYYDLLKMLRFSSAPLTWNHIGTG